MNKLTHSLLAKIVAVFLIAVTFFGSLFCAGSIVAINALGGYEGTAEHAKALVAEKLLYRYADGISEKLFAGVDPFEWYKDANFWFTLSYQGSNEVTNYDGGKYLCRVETRIPYTHEIVSDTDGTEYWDTVYADAVLYAKADTTRRDLLSSSYSLIDGFFRLQPLFFCMMIIGALMFFVLLVFLICAAGHRKGYDEPIPNRFDKIPFDLLAACYILVILAEILVLFAYNYYIAQLIGVIIFAVVDFFLLLSFVYTFAARIKTGTLIKNTILYRVCRFASKIIWRFFKRLWYIFSKIPLVFKTAMIIFAVSSVELLAFIASEWELSTFFVFWMLEKLVLVPAVLYVAILLKKLQIGGEKIADGNLNYKINTTSMFADFKRYGESLNNISMGMKKAVDEQMKSERFKTELITNVSHDIKTPLTSIINYVDLIKKEDTDNDRIKEYTEVLDRQSTRLKKLIDDLVEASKASSGALSVDLKPCEIGVLLSQTAGEYQEKLAEKGLELVLTQPEAPVTVMADGRHLWRIFDNLMNNIVKYSQPSTRVYLTLEMINGCAVTTFRNISKTQLNISSDELMERFVRGDSSRNTEGSGLGLSIAKSLTELQGGDFSLTVDGDLFKAAVTFKTIGG